MAITLYHAKHNNGDDSDQPSLKHARTFRPQPTAEQIAKLEKAGWKHSPTEMPDHKHLESAGGASASDLFLEEDNDELEDILGDDDTAIGNQPPAVPKDIRVIPVKEAITIINTISDKATLLKINKREKSGSKARKSVLNAIAARLEDVG